MKSRRTTRRSFPGRLTLEEWLALPYLGRLDLTRRAQCELFGCQRLCASKQCRRHHTCCGDDAQACEQRLWHLTKPKPKTMWRESGRLSDLAKLPGPDGWPLWKKLLKNPPPSDRVVSGSKRPGESPRGLVSGRAVHGSDRNPASRPARADKEGSDAGLWEIIQTGQPGEGDKAPDKPS
jgi:hypothetical protein